jgi:hypothetical protein
MNNKIQRQFDRSIKDAVRITKEANDRKPRRDLTARVNAMPTERAMPSKKGRLYLDPITGGTVWDPTYCSQSDAKAESD